MPTSARSAIRPSSRLWISAIGLALIGLGIVSAVREERVWSSGANGFQITALTAKIDEFNTLLVVGSVQGVDNLSQVSIAFGGLLNGQQCTPDEVGSFHHTHQFSTSTHGQISAIGTFRGPLGIQTTPEVTASF